MAYVNTRSSAARVGLADRISALLKSVQDARRRHAVYNQTVRELKMLSDRDLADLGINPMLIDSIARQAAYGK